MNSVSIFANRVHWTRFAVLENEFNELGLQEWKPSSINSFSILTNRVQWTRFPFLQTEFIELIF